MLIPSTLVQAAALLLLIVPGLVLTSTRRFLVGPTPEDKEFGVRIARSIGVSVLLDLIYVIVAGPLLFDPFSVNGRDDESRSALEVLGERPRYYASVLLALLIFIPVVLAFVSMIRPRRPRWGRSKWFPLVLTPRAHPVPSAWDKAAPTLANCGVRIFTPDGHWVGGWISSNGRSFISKHPEPRDIFIEWEWKMDQHGNFVEPIDGSNGLYVPLSGSERVAWVTFTGQTGMHGDAPEKAHTE